MGLIDCYQQEEPDGEVTVEVYVEDYVSIRYHNVYSKDHDHQKGFIIEMRTLDDEVVIKLDDGTRAHFPQGNIYINDRRYGRVRGIEVIKASEKG